MKLSEKFIGIHCLLLLDFFYAGMGWSRGECKWIMFIGSSRMKIVSAFLKTEAQLTYNIMLVLGAQPRTVLIFNFPSQILFCCAKILTDFTKNT